MLANLDLFSQGNHMGSIIVLEGTELNLFADKLRELRAKLFVDPLFNDTLLHLYKIRLWPNEHVEFEYQEPTSDAEAIAADRTIQYLEGWLDDEDKLMELAAIGPCTLHLGWDELAEGPISIGIENYIPDCEPNLDWRLNPRYGGLQFTS